MCTKTRSFWRRSGVAAGNKRSRKGISGRLHDLLSASSFTKKPTAARTCGSTKSSSRLPRPRQPLVPAPDVPACVPVDSAFLTAVADWRVFLGTWLGPDAHAALRAAVQPGHPGVGVKHKGNHRHKEQQRTTDGKRLGVAGRGAVRFAPVADNRPGPRAADGEHGHDEPKRRGHHPLAVHRVRTNLVAHVRRSCAAAETTTAPGWISVAR